MLSHRTIDNRLYELEKQEWRDGEKLTRKITELKNNLEAATKGNVKLERDMSGDRANQGTKRRTAERESSSVSGGAEIEWHSRGVMSGP